MVNFSDFHNVFCYFAGFMDHFKLTPLLYNPFIVNFGYGKSWGPCTSTHGYVMPMSCRLLEFVDCWDGSVNYVWLDIVNF